MAPPERPHNADPETHEAGERQAGGQPQPSVETREAGLMRRALHALAAVPQTAPEAPERIPSVEEQLQLICEVGTTLRMIATSTEQKNKLWEAYKKCIDDFRDAIGLPPVDKAHSVYKWRIGSAMEHGNVEELMRIFNEEKKERAKPPWYKRMPGFNFLFGVVGGAGEMGSNLYELGRQGAKAAAGDEQAREVLRRVGQSFMELDRVFATVTRKDEYVKSIEEEGGETTGYVLGKSAFDLASALLTGGAGGAAGRGLAAGSHGVREAAHVAGHAAGHVLAEGVHVAGHAAHGSEGHAPEKSIAEKPKKMKKPKKVV